MFHTLKPDGTEGTATCTLNFPLQGCIVSSQDKNLELYIQSGIDFSQNRNLLSDYEYFFYSPYDDITAKAMEQVENIVIQYPKYKDPDHKKKEYTLERKLNPVIVDNSHLFILCESEKLNKCSFLKDHSIKEIRMDQQSLGEEIYGLGKIKDKLPGFIKMKIEKSIQLSSNEYEVHLNSEDFEKLLKTGPILDDEKNLVGSFVKVEVKSCNIYCCTFELGKKAIGLGNSNESGVDDMDNKMGNKRIEKESSEYSDSETDYDDSYPNSKDGRRGHDHELLKFSEEVTDKQTSRSSFMSSAKTSKDLKKCKEKEEEENRLKLCAEELAQENRQLKEKIEKLQNQQTEKLEEEKMQLKQQAEKLDEEKKQLQKQQNEKLEEENRELKQRIKKLEEKIEKLYQKIEKLDEEEKQLQKQRYEKLEKENKELKRQMEEAQKQTALEQLRSYPCRTGAQYKSDFLPLD